MLVVNSNYWNCGIYIGESLKTHYSPDFVIHISCKYSPLFTCKSMAGPHWSLSGCPCLYSGSQKNRILAPSRSFGLFLLPCAKDRILSMNFKMFLFLVISNIITIICNGKYQLIPLKYIHIWDVISQMQTFFTFWLKFYFRIWMISIQLFPVHLFQMK